MTLEEVALVYGGCLHCCCYKRGFGFNTNKYRFRLAYFSLNLEEKIN